jgi:3-mercaptopyruvate sulfurtransferase SseA
LTKKLVGNLDCLHHNAASRYGTLPGAQNFSHDQWFLAESATLKPKSEIESLAKRAGLIHEKEFFNQKRIADCARVPRTPELGRGDQLR